MTDKEFQLERELSDAKATIRRLEGELKCLKSGDKRTMPLAETRVTEAFYENGKPNGQFRESETYKDGVKQ